MNLESQNVQQRLFKFDKTALESFPLQGKQHLEINSEFLNDIDLKRT